MAKTYNDLRNSIAAFMHREPGTFLVGGHDALLQAVNNAKNYCQRAIDFERARVFATLDASDISTGTALSEAREYGTTLACPLKSVEAVFLMSTSGALTPLDFVHRDEWVRRVAKTQTSSSCLTIVQYGDLIYLAPTSGDTSDLTLDTIYLDGVRWLPDFGMKTVQGSATSTLAGALVCSTGNFVNQGVRVGDVARNATSGASALITAVTATTLTLTADIFTNGQEFLVPVVNSVATNFLLDYCFDYLMYHSIVELNFFLKEDQRVALSDSFMQRAWGNVVAWNTTCVRNSVTSADLS